MPPNIDLNFDELYKIPLTAMKINNSHPAIQRTMFWFLTFAIQHAVHSLTFFAIFMNIFICAKNDDFSSASKHSALCVVYVVITFQHLTLSINRELVLKFIETIKNDYKQDRSYDEKIIIHKYAMKARKVCIFWLFVTVIPGFLFPVKHLILEVYYTIISGQFQLIEVYPMTYPSIVEENKFHPLVFSVIYIVLIYHMLYDVITAISMIPFGPICMLHACAILEIAKKNLRELNINSIEEFKSKLEYIVETLQHVYSFVDDINVVLALVHEVILKATTIGIPLILWELKTGISRGEVSIEFVSIIIGGSLISITPCYYSQILIKKGNDIATLIYASGWEKAFDRSIRKSVQIILFRAQRTVAIRGLFHVFGMEVLTDIFHQAYAIFNMMNVMWK